MAKVEVQGVVTASGTKVWMYFDAQEKLRRFTGDISPSVLPFTSAGATLTYTNIESLSGAKTITSGTIGTYTFSVYFDDGNSVVGTINKPLADSIPITGSGVWDTPN